jgi:hypothetical protein
LVAQGERNVKSQEKARKEDFVIRVCENGTAVVFLSETTKVPKWF